MELRQVIKSAIEPAYEILGSKYATVEATLMSLAIGGQESKFLSRRQLITEDGKLVPKGPAVSFWQFEQGGGVRGVIEHPTSKALCSKLTAARGVKNTPSAVWAEMQVDDILGAGMTRLLLLTDPRRLPAVGQINEAWELYKRVWRPGKPHPQTWEARYGEAMKALGL